MKKILVFLLFCSFTSFGQTTFKGKVLASEDSLPISLVTVQLIVDNKETEYRTITGDDGNFSLVVPTIESSDFSLHFSLVGLTTVTLKPNLEDKEELIIYMSLLENPLSELLVSSYSSASSWVGATLAYNLDGKSSENVIGAAKVKINSVKRFDGKRFNLNIIGNISKFTGIVDKDELELGIRDIIQSSQGLSVGLEPLFNVARKEDMIIRVWSNLNYKLNQFQNIEVDAELVDVSLSQFRFALGAEIETFQLSDGGRFMHLGVELSQTFFDEAKYLQVFNESESSLFALEWSFILPLNGTLGIVFGQVISPDIKPTFNAGLIIAAGRQ